MADPSTPTLPQIGEETARELLAVEQVDRDAAADLAAQFQRYTFVQIEAPSIRRGEHDDWELVQAFARHRLATLTHPISREAVARLAALRGLGTLDGRERRGPPNEKWTQEEWEKRILECVPEGVEKHCYALADAIISLGRADESGREAVLEEAALALVRAHDASALDPDNLDLENAELDRFTDLRYVLATPPSPCCLGVVERIVAVDARPISDAGKLLEILRIARTALQSHRGEGR